MNKEQMRIVCHINKCTVLYLLQSNLAIPVPERKHALAV